MEESISAKKFSLIKLSKGNLLGIVPSSKT